MDVFTFFQGGKVVNYSDRLGYNTGQDAPYVEYPGTYQAIDDQQRIKFVEAQKNLYFNTTNGIQYLTDLTSTPATAGVPRAIDLSNPSVTASATGWFTAGYSVAYRVVYGLKDNNGNLKLGVPTGRLLITNTTTAAKASFTIFFPAEVAANPTKFFYRVYRTRAFDPNTTPDDELFLVREASVTDAGGASFYVYTDVTPEALLGDPLYTNPKTGDGILASNFRPPIAKDMTLWQESVWYANTSGPQRFSLQMLGTGTPDGVQAGDKIAIGKRVYVAGTTFSVTTGGQPSANVRTTTTDLVTQINTREISTGYVTPGVFASSASADNEAAGKIQLEGVALSTAQFHVAASRPASWNPVLPNLFTVASAFRAGSSVFMNTSTAHNFAVGDQVWLATDGETTFDSNYPPGLKTITAISASSLTYIETGTTNVLDFTGHAYYVYKASTTNASDSAVLPNGIVYSKFQEPESCPLANYLYVGKKNSGILRIAAIKDKLFVFKEEGIYVVSGIAGQYRVDLLDQTARLFAPNALTSLNNRLYALTTQGVVSISDAGVGIISHAIETELTAIMQNTGFSAFAKNLFWAVGHESERMLYVGVFASASLTGGSGSMAVYAFNLITRAWTRLQVQRNFAAVDPTTDLLWFADGQFGLRLLRESRYYDYLDYVDNYVDEVVTVTGSSGLTMTLSTTTSLVQGYPGPEIKVGDVIKSGSIENLITAINGTTVTVNDSVLPNGTYKLLRGIPCTVEYSPLTGGQPGGMKQFSQAIFHLLPGNVSTFTPTFRTELSTSATSTTPANSSFSYQADPANDQVNLWTLVPREKQRAATLRVGFKVCEAYARWAVAGFTLDADGFDGLRDARK